MSLSPADIASRQFSIALRGYEKSEVDAFLAEIAAELDRRLGETSGRPADPASFAQLGQEVTAVLETATTAAEGLRARAREDADAMRAAAERDSQEMLERAREEAEETRRAAEEAAASLTRETEEYTTDLRTTTEREAREMREAAIVKARATEETAEADARRIRAQAEQEASELLDEALRRHARLKAFERETRARATAVEQALRSIMNELRAAEAEDGREDGGDGGQPEVPAFTTDNSQPAGLLDAWNAPAQSGAEEEPRKVTPAASVHFDDTQEGDDNRLGWLRDDEAGQDASRP